MADIKKESNDSELYKRYRPSQFKEVVGHTYAVDTLKKMLSLHRVPHTLLFSGPSGCGKTTLVRILRSKLECGSSDFTELNGASSRGIDDMRAIARNMYLSPISGKCRIFYIDECHKLTSDAQNSLLKPLEDTPSHVYFMLSTTDPDKVIKTIRNRATHIKLNKLSISDLQKLLNNVLSSEGRTLSEEVTDRLVDAADGSARQLLILLDQVLKFSNEEDQLNAIVSKDVQKQAYDVFKALINPGVKWNEMASILKSINEDPEGIRRLVLACATTALLAGGKSSNRAYIIINAFRDNYFDSGKSGLAASCYEVITCK